MQSFLLALASLLLLVPIVYFLPIGLTRTGKLLSILIAFSVALLGLFAKNVFPLWEIALLLAAMVFILSYFVNKRFNRVFFVSIPTDLDDSFHKDVNSNDEIEISKDSIPTDNFLHMEMDFSNEVSIGFQNDETYGFIDEYDEIDKNLDLNQKDETVEGLVDTEIQTTVDELADITPLSFLEYLEEEKMSRNSEDAELKPSDAGILSDLEKLLQEESVVLEMEGFESETEESEDVRRDNYSILLEEESRDLELEDSSAPLTSREIQPELGELLEETLSETQLNIHEEKIEKMNLNPIVTDRNWLEHLDDLDELSFQTSPALASFDNGNIVDNTEIELEDDSKMDKENKPFLEETTSMDEKVDVEKEIEYSTEEVTYQKHDSMQQKLFYTVASQLKLYGKKMDLEQYETLIKKNLHPNLPVHDYYTFASLLIERYIIEKQFERLEEFLVEIKEKIGDFQILKMELDYLYERYCENSHKISL